MNVKIALAILMLVALSITAQDSLISGGNFLGSGSGPRREDPAVIANQENQRIYYEQLASLNSLTKHLKDLQSYNVGDFFRVVDGVTNYVYDYDYNYPSGWEHIEGKVIQTLPNGILVTSKKFGDEDMDVFISNYPFRTVDDQMLSSCLVKEDGVYSFTAVSGGARTVKKYEYGITVVPSPELLEKEINATKDEIQNHPLVLKAKADIAARQKAKEKNYEAQANVIRWLQPQATNGDASAQCDLGEHYLNGQGCETNKTLAIFWLQKAAAQGDSEASNKLVKINLVSTNAISVGNNAN